MIALIVDDEEEICILLRHRLKVMGIEAEIAHNLKEGLGKFSQSKFDIIFLDINLPDGNGLQFIPTLRNIDDKVMITIISAYDSQSEKKLAFELGADEFLSKPFNKEVINATVERIKKRG